MRISCRFAFAWLIACVLVLETSSAAEPTVKQLVERLQSKNTAPKIDDEGVPQFKDFDWDDQHAVVAAGTKLLGKMDEAWPLLINNIDRGGYSLTLRRRDEETGDNITPGEFSELLVRRAIVVGYRDLAPADDRLSRAMHKAGFVPFDKFKEWCKEQNRLGRSLVDVQLEGCRWARDLVSAADDLPVVEKEKTLALLDARIHQIKTSRVAIKSNYPFDRDGTNIFEMR